MSPTAKAIAAAFVTVVLWASAFPFIRVGLRSFDPIALAALRFAVAGLAMTGWFMWRGAARPSPPDAARLALCAAIGIVAYNLLLNAGQRSVPAAAASFIVNTVPVITALLALACLKERFRGFAWLGTGISFAGVALIASAQPGGIAFGAGAALVLAAAICQAAFFILQRPLLAKYGPGPCAAIVVTFGALFLVPWLPSALTQANAAPVSGLLAVAYLGLFPAAIGYATWSAAQAHFGASRAANFLYLVPPTATVLAFGIASETPTPATLAGGTLAIAGVILVNLNHR